MVSFYQPKKALLPKKKLTVTIHALDSFGQGVAHHQGKTIFVKSAPPNESVDIVVTEDKKRYAKANVINYHNQSIERIEPTCSYYQTCGGCEMQHFSSDLQQQTKLNSLMTLLERETETSLRHLINNAQTVIADSPYHYRRRARLAINVVKNELQIGFRKSESNQIVNIEHCSVLTKDLDALLPSLQHCLQKIKYPKVLGHAELISVDSGIILILRHIKLFTEEDQLRLKTFAEHENLSLYLHGEQFRQLSGKNEHYYLIDLPTLTLTLKLTFSPLDFIQVNSNINQKMIITALDWLDLKTNDHVLDLFCVMGNFSLPLATRCNSVTGVEVIKNLVDKATVNVLLNKAALLAKQVHFFVGDLDDHQQFSVWNAEKISHAPKFNKVLLDPARAGAFSVMTEIVKMAPDRIVYVSCNSTTLVSDSKLLIDAGYEIARITILDMFPQTKHVESMLLFMKLGL